MLARSLWAAFFLTVAACDPPGGDPQELTTEIVDQASTPPGGAGAGVSTAAATKVLAAVCAAAAGPTRRDQVCHRWTCDGTAATEAAPWSGDAATCDPGTMDGAAANRTLSLVNLHRFLADIPPVAIEPAWSAAAQQCALLAHANGALSHTPGHDWRCYTDVGALAASASLIANRSAPPAVDAFVEDPGNADTMVHRRWLLDEELTRIAVGSTSQYSCVVVVGEKLGGGKKDDAPTTARGWVAWPPAGPVPLDVFTGEKLDELGWTVQSSDSDLDRHDVTVSVTVAGSPKPVTLVHLEALHGSTSAIRFVPDGWTTEAGASYDVVVTTGGATKLAFTVEPVACP